MATSHKKKPASPTLDGRKPIKDIKLPDKIATRSVTAKSLGKGTYQKAILAAVAPILIPDMINSLRRSTHLNDMQANKLIAEIFGLTGAKDRGLVVNVNQQNNNTAESHAHRASDGPRSFEDIQRILEEEEKQRKAIPASFDVISFEPTPDAVLVEE